MSQITTYVHANETAYFPDSSPLAHLAGNYEEDVESGKIIPPYKEPNFVVAKDLYEGQKNCPYCMSVLSEHSLKNLLKTLLPSWKDRLLARSDTKHFKQKEETGEVKYFKRGSLFGAMLGQSESLSYKLRSCSVCGWWYVGRITTNFGIYGFEDIYRIRQGVIKKYSIDSTDVPVQELRRHLVKNNKDITDIHPKQFELLIRDCMKDMFGDCEVIHMGYVRDRGIDLKIVKGSKVEYLVQVKRRSKISHTESVQVVRELNGVLLREGVRKGIVVTSGKKFSDDAKLEASQVSKRRYFVSLLDQSDVFQLLDLNREHPDVMMAKGFLPLVAHCLSDELKKKITEALNNDS